MSELKEISTAADEGVSIVSDVLKEAVERVSSGEVVGVAVTMLTRKRGQEWLTGGTYSTSEMVGGLELTKIAVIQSDKE